MPKLPFYEKPKYPFFTVAPKTTIHMMEIVSFLKWIIDKEQLEIANYFDAMREDPFFLVAATGLGKTVGVPVHVLIRQIQKTGKSPNPSPKVWIVEPRIPIAIDQSKYMNWLWKEYASRTDRQSIKSKPLFGCVSSVSGRINPDAPVQFVTTGIFELLAREDKLDPVNDRVVIDEAHVTVEQNPGVELGIALAKAKGVCIDYMSATVDVSNIESSLGVGNIIRADEQRNIIWKSNLLKPLDEALVELVKATLISPDKTSMYYPQDDFKHARKVIESSLEGGRSHGMLVVVNSFSGETSDIAKLSNQLRLKVPELPVLHLASEIIRNPKQEQDFRARLSQIENEKRNYLIFSTSVVEMGITFPTLDYVVTMDSGYDQETIGDISFPVVAPLGVNSLLQRIGRVGRKRPGIAYISNEVGADYSALEDAELNSKALSYEAIKFPLSSAPLMPLVYYAVKNGADDFDGWLENLNLPSKIHLDKDRMIYFDEQLEKLEKLGITENGRLTKLGEKMEQWIGRADIAYATQLQKRFYEGAPHEEVLFWITATALSNTPPVALRAQFGYFADHKKTHEKAKNRLNLWGKPALEDVAVFRLIATLSDLAPSYLWNAKVRSDETEEFFKRWCNWCGLDGRKIVKAFESIREILELFQKINSGSDEFKLLVEKLGSFDGAKIDWRAASENLNTAEASRQVIKLAGVTRINLKYNEAISAYEWTDKLHGHKGIITQDDTPIELLERDYSARVIPSRQNKGDEASWRILSLGLLKEASPQQTTTAKSSKPPAKSKTATSLEPETPKKKGFWAWIFS